MTDSNARIFIDALRRLEEHADLDGMVGLFAEEAELRNPTDDTPHRGREGARRFWGAYRHTFEEIHSEFHNVAETDGAVMLEWTSHGRSSGGQEIEYDGVSVVEFRGNRVSRFRAYFDPNRLEAQIEPTR